MAPRTKQQFLEIRESMTQKIVVAATELFATEGYFPTSIRDIARKAGISKGLLYNYFESKEALLKTIALQGMQEIIDQVKPKQNGLLGKEELRNMISGMFRSIDEKRHFWKLYFMIMVQPSVSKLITEDIWAAWIPYQQTLVRSLEAMGAEDPLTDAIFIQCLLDGITANFVMAPGTIQLDNLEKKIVQMFNLA